jgi:hypothetical protein
MTARQSITSEFNFYANLYHEKRLSKLYKLLYTGLALLSKKFKAMTKFVARKCDIPAVDSKLKWMKAILGTQNAMSQGYWEPLREKVWLLKWTMKLGFLKTGARRNYECQNTLDPIVKNAMQEMRRLRWKDELFSHWYLTNSFRYRHEIEQPDSDEMTFHGHDSMSYSDISKLYEFKYLALVSQFGDERIRVEMPEDELLMIEEALKYGFQAIAMEKQSSSEFFENPNKQLAKLRKTYHRALVSFAHNVIQHVCTLLQMNRNEMNRKEIARAQAGETTMVVNNEEDYEQRTMNQNIQLYRTWTYPKQKESVDNKRKAYDAAIEAL